MALRYVLDEHLRGPLFLAIRRHNATSTYPIDVVRVGDPPDLPLGIPDEDILVWAERENRIIVSADVRTFPAALAAHVAAGRQTPGLSVLRPRAILAEVLDFLVLAAYASEPHEWAGRAESIG